MADVAVDGLGVWMSSDDQITYVAALDAAEEAGTAAETIADWLALADGHWGTVQAPPA